VSCRFSVQVTTAFRTRRPGSARLLYPTTQDRRGGAVAGGRRWEGVPTGMKLTPDGETTWRAGWMSAAATVTDLAGDAVAAVLQDPMH
jgi:hypothetical protein